MKNKFIKHNKQIDKIFCFSLLLLLYRHRKWRLAETEIYFHLFGNVVIGVTILSFPRKDKFWGPELFQYYTDYSALYSII